MSRATMQQISFADWELMQQAIHYEPMLKAISDFLAYDEPIGTGVVQRAVRNAYRRCGLPHTRVHILRHSVASRLLRAGTPLKEIADVLRHRSLDTSAIYIK